MAQRLTITWAGTQIPWIAMTIWTAAIGTATADWLHLSNPHRFPLFATAFLIVSALAAAAIVAIVARHAARRAAVVAELVEALHTPLGWPAPSHGLISASGWKTAPRADRRAHGIYPTKIRMHYIPAAAVKQQSSLQRLQLPAGDNDPDTAGTNPEWLRLINSLLSENLGVSYTLSVDRRARRLTATPDTREVTEEPAAIQRLRAKVASPAMFESGATVTDYTLSDRGRITEFDVAHNISEKLARSGARMHQIERVMSKILAGRWRADFKLEHDTVHFELRPSLPRLVWPRIYPEMAGVAEAIANYKNTRFFYAYDEDRNPISWHPKTQPQRLIIGPTGSGKTSTIHTFITQAARAHWAVNIADRKNIEYRGFRDWPNVQCVATRIEDQIALIYQTWMLMKDRYEAGESGVARTEDFSPVLLVLDEFTELVKDIAAWYVKLRGSKPASETKNWPRELPIEEMVGSVLRLGRTARIHLIIGMQRPDVKYVEGENRDNLTGRQSLGRLGRQGADMLWGDYYTGTTIPPGLLGRGMAYNDHGEPVEVQNFFTPDPYKPDDLTDPVAKRVLKELRPTSCSHPRIVFDTPFDPHEDEDFHYTDYLEARVYLAEERPALDPLSPQYRFKPRLSAATAFAATSALGPNTAHHNAAPMPVTGPTRQRHTAGSDRWPGYGSPAPRMVDDLQVGDLICVDAGLGVWGILEKTPEPDPVDPNALLLSWRSADDDYDLLTVPADDSIVSRPLLDDADQSRAA